MSKSALVKLGMPAPQAQAMKRARQIRQVVDQFDAMIVRAEVAMAQRIREILNGTDEATEATEAKQATEATEGQPSVAA
jgi:hypothetical protein